MGLYVKENIIGLGLHSDWGLDTDTPTVPVVWYTSFFIQ